MKKKTDGYIIINKKNCTLQYNKKLNQISLRFFPIYREGTVELKFPQHLFILK